MGGQTVRVGVGVAITTGGGTAGAGIGRRGGLLVAALLGLDDRGGAAGRSVGTGTVDGGSDGAVDVGKQSEQIPGSWTTVPRWGGLT